MNVKKIVPIFFAGYKTKSGDAYFAVFYNINKAAGKVRLEGKDYIVQDGDIINFRFNV